MSQQTITNIQTLIWKEFSVDDAEESCGYILRRFSLNVALSVCVSDLIRHYVIDICAQLNDDNDNGILYFL